MKAREDAGCAGVGSGQFGHRGSRAPRSQVRQGVSRFGVYTSHKPKLGACAAYFANRSEPETAGQTRIPALLPVDSLLAAGVVPFLLNGPVHLQVELAPARGADGIPVALCRARATVGQ